MKIRLKYLCKLNPISDKSLYGQKCTFLPMEKILFGTTNNELETIFDKEKSGYTFMKEGYVIRATVTPCFENGKGAVLNSLTNGFAIGSTELMCVKPTKINAHLLNYIFLSTDFVNHCQKDFKGVGGLKRINQKNALNYEISVSVLEKQDDIVLFLDKNCSKIDKEVSLLQQKSILLDEYKNALIYETVTKGIDKNAEMRDSGVEWIGEIPKHWSVNRLKDKLNIQKGAVFTDDLIKDDGVYPYINGGIKPSGLTNSFNCRENTIAVSEGGASSGYSQFMETKFWAGTHCYKINPKRNENSKYYYYLLKGFEKQIQAAKTGSAMPNLQKSKFINLVFSFTSNLKEQNEIVKYLDNETKKIEKQIGLINKKVELLKEYKQSLIYEAVTGQLEIE